MTDDNLDDVSFGNTKAGIHIKAREANIRPYNLGCSCEDCNKEFDEMLNCLNQTKFNCIKERINEKPKCKEQCDTCKYFRSEYAKLSNGDFAASQVIPDSVGKSISELSVFEREVRNKTLDDCIEKMEIAIELIRKMKT